MCIRDSRARNKHGGWSERVSSTGVRVCLRAPSIGRVSDGLDPSEADGERDASAFGYMEVGWADFKDECALGVDTYTLTIQRRLDASDPATRYRDAQWADDRRIVLGRAANGALLAGDDDEVHGNLLAWRRWKPTWLAGGRHLSLIHI